MRAKISKMPLLFAVALCASVLPLQSQPARNTAEIGPIEGASFHTRYIRLGADTGGLLYEPNVLGPKARFAMVQTHPSSNNFSNPSGREMASRGYRVLLIDYHGRDLAPEAMMEDYLPSLSRGIGYLRGLPGVEHVLVMGHSGGASMTALYGAVSTVGPSACQGPDKIYPCNGKNIAHLQKADGFIMLDSPLGAFERMSGIELRLDGPWPRFLPGHVQRRKWLQPDDQGGEIFARVHQAVLCRPAGASHGQHGARLGTPEGNRGRQERLRR